MYLFLVMRNILCICNTDNTYDYEIRVFKIRLSTGSLTQNTLTKVKYNLFYISYVLQTFTYIKYHSFNIDNF